MRTVSGLLWPPTETGHDAAYRPQYWLYLQVLWYTLACQFAIAPRLATGIHLLTDGWLFKFYAKMGLRGIPSKHLDEIFASILAPDLVILLECEVESAWGRRTFRDHEMGLHEDYVKLGVESYVDYQTRVQAALKALADARGWPSVKIRPSDGLDTTATEVEDLIRQFLRSRKNAPQGGNTSDRVIAA
jgi:thymidylate kinase